MSDIPTHDKKVKVDPPFSGPLARFEAWLYDMLYDKVPFKLPKSVQDVLVQFGPWITLVVAIISLPAILTLFGIGAVASYYTALVGVTYTPMHYIAIVVLVVQIVIMLVAVSPLLKRQRKGWQLLFYASTISVAYSLFDSLGSGGFAILGLIWGLIGAAISYYVIFQIRAHYKS